jgi:hypothetical protein
MMIRQASDFPNVQQRGGYRPWIEFLVQSRWPGFIVTWNKSEITITAEIVRSNWVAVCPHCQTPILTEPDDLLFCPDCLMQADNFLAVTVKVPVMGKEIEDLLVKRPDPMTRNWTTRETLEDLAAENAEHGVG